MDVNELDNFEEVRNNLQMIEEMLNRMPLEHGGENDVFAVTAKDMDDLLSNVTPDMNGKDVVEKAKPILHTCHKVLELGHNLISANLDDAARRAIQVGRGDIEVDKMQLA